MEDWKWVAFEFSMIDTRAVRGTAERKVGKGAFIVG
jgi:hypothetical protein